MKNLIIEFSDFRRRKIPILLNEHAQSHNLLVTNKITTTILPSIIDVYGFIAAFRRIFLYSFIKNEDCRESSSSLILFSYR